MRAIQDVLRSRPAFLTLFILAGVLPLAVIIAVPAARSFGSVEIWPIIVIAYSSARIASTVGSSRPRPVGLMFWSYSYVFFGLAGYAQLRSGRFPFEATDPSPEHIATAYVATLIAFLAFDLGNRHTRGRRISRPRFLERRLPATRVFAVSAIGILASAAILFSLGGLDALFRPRNTLNDQLNNLLDSPITSGPVLSAILRVPLSVAFLASVALAVGERRRRGFVSPRIRWLTLATATATLVVINPVSTQRFWLGTVVVALLTVVAGWRSGNRVAVMAIGVILGVVILFPLASTFRGSTDVDLADRVDNFNPIAELGTSGDFDSLQQAVGAVALAESAGFEYGEHTLGAMLFWVPRSFWPGKPEGGSRLIAEFLDLDEGNFFSLPIWAGLYLDAGFLAVALGMFAYGRGARALESAYGAPGSHREATIAEVAVPLISAYQFFLLRGDLLPALAFLTPVVGVVWILGVRVPMSRRPDREIRRAVVRTGHGVSR